MKESTPDSSPEHSSSLPGLMENFKLSPEALELAISDEIDRILNKPARVTLPPGYKLMLDQQVVEGIWLVHTGEVKLFRMVEGEEIIFHRRTVGPVIGLLALALEGKSLFNVVTVTEVKATYVSFPDLDSAMKKSPVLQGYLNTQLVRSFAIRQKRSAELHIEVKTLNHHVQTERDQLAEVLRNLRQTQTLLVESEKMATLGQLSAGVAHDLNNPVAAIQRYTEYLRDDLHLITPEMNHGELFQALMDKNEARSAVSTREERKARKELESILDDAGLARRLVRAGVYSRAEYDKYFSDLTGQAWEERLTLMALAARMGTALRNMRSCSSRIINLVKSLKSYARVDADCEIDCDLNRCLSDTLLLFRHACKDIEVIKEFGKLPGISCYSGELNQVWTNLIANALEAMDRKGRLEIRTEPLSDGGVAIHIIDNGPGIPAERIDQIFDLNFSTKKGQINFGLGIGLSICHQIVTRNGGEIDVNSRPGHTDFVVILPAQPPTRRSSTAEVPDKS